MLFINKLFNSIACLLSFTNLQLVIPGRTWILLYLGRTVYKRLWAYLALYQYDVLKTHLDVKSQCFCRKGDPFVDELTEGIRRLQEDGDLHLLYRKWWLPPGYYCDEKD